LPWQRSAVSLNILDKMSPLTLLLSSHSLCVFIFSNRQGFDQNEQRIRWNKDIKIITGEKKFCSFVLR
jgi:hypothetical protein